VQRADCGGSDLSGMTFQSFMNIDIGASILKMQTSWIGKWSSLLGSIDERVVLNQQHRSLQLNSISYSKSLKFESERKSFFEDKDRRS